MTNKKVRNEDNIYAVKPLITALGGKEGTVTMGKNKKNKQQSVADKTGGTKEGC